MGNAIYRIDESGNRIRVRNIRHYAAAGNPIRDRAVRYAEETESGTLITYESGAITDFWTGDMLAHEFSSNSYVGSRSVNFYTGSGVYVPNISGYTDAVLVAPDLEYDHIYFFFYVDNIAVTRYDGEGSATLSFMNKVYGGGGSQIFTLQYLETTGVTTLQIAATDICTVDIDKWYKIDITDIDWGAGTCTIKIYEDGVLVDTHTAFDFSSINVSDERFLLGNVQVNGNVQVADIDVQLDGCYYVNGYTQKWNRINL